jgi:type II secretory pathway component PulF
MSGENKMETHGDKPGHSAGALILLAVDLLVALCLIVELVFVVPRFGAIFQDFGVSLPVATQLAVSLSRALNAFHGLGFSLLFCLVPGMIIWMYLSLHRLGDRKKLFTRLWTVWFVLVLLMGSITCTMFLPMGGMSDGLNESTPSANQQ